MISIEENYHQRGESIMAQGVLPFKYETGKKAAGMTAPGGLPAYPDVAHTMSISKSIHTHLKVRAGGDCVDDIKVLEAVLSTNRVVRLEST